PVSEVLTFVTYNSNGDELLASQSLENSPRAEVWLFSTKEAPTTHEPQHLVVAGPVLHAAFSPLDDRLVIASADGTAVLWSKFNNNYQRIRSFKHKAQVFKADFSPDGQYIVTASRDHRALIWNADSGELAHPSLYHSGSVTDCGFSDHGHHLITLS